MSQQTLIQIPTSGGHWRHPRHIEKSQWEEINCIQELLHRATILCYRRQSIDNLLSNGIPQNSEITSKLCYLCLHFIFCNILCNSRCVPVIERIYLVSIWDQSQYKYHLSGCGDFHYKDRMSINKIGALETNFSEMLIKIQFSLKRMYLNMSLAKRQPFVSAATLQQEMAVSLFGLGDEPVLSCAIPGYLVNPALG